MGEDSTNFTEENTYDAEGNLRGSKDRNDVWTRFEYDSLDRPTKRIDAADTLKYETNFAYELGEIAVPYGVMGGADLEYRVASDPRGNVSVVVFDTDNVIQAEYDAAGRATTYDHDDLGRVTDIFFPDGGHIHRELDGRGRITEQTGPTVEKTTYKHDDEDRTEKVTRANPGVRRSSHDVRVQRDETYPP